MSYTPELNAVVVSQGNSSTAPLAASGMFTGTAENVTPFAEVSVNLHASPATASGTLTFEFSPDGVNWDTSVPMFVSDPTQFTPFPLRITMPWFRVRYQNNGMPQSSLRLTTVFHTRSSKNLTRLTTQTVGQNEPVEIVRAVTEPSLSSRHLAASADRAIFGDAVVSTRHTQILTRFDQPIGVNPVTTSVAGGGSVSQSDGQVTVSTGAAGTASARIESTKRVRYHPGKEIYAIFTARFTAPTSASSHQRIGIYDDDNGFFIGWNGTNFGHTRRRAGTDTFFPRATIWNGDPMDGSGSSAFTRNRVPEPINFARFNIYRIRFGWLGSASVLFEVMAPDGGWVIMHTATVPNALSITHITNPSLPMRAEVIKSAADATVLEVGTASWNGGTIEDVGAFPLGEARGRDAVEKSLSLQTVSAVIHPVVPGKRVSVMSLIVSILNTSAVAEGQWNLRDGPGGAIKVPVIVPKKSGAPDGYLHSPMVFAQPLTFQTSVYGEVAAGSLTWSAAAVGYEELA